MIELQMLEDMFSNMRTKTKWDVDDPMLWGYFFTDPKEEKLQRAATELTAQDYDFVRIYSTDDGTTRFLHVERLEVHTPETLFARNKQLDTLAKEFGLESYDGMDVGPSLP